MPQTRARRHVTIAETTELTLQLRRLSRAAGTDQYLVEAVVAALKAAGKTIQDLRDIDEAGGFICTDGRWRRIELRAASTPEVETLVCTVKRGKAVRVFTQYGNGATTWRYNQIIATGDGFDIPGIALPYVVTGLITEMFAS